MASVDKAEKFADVAEEHGWEVEILEYDDIDRADCICTRKDEQVSIFWEDNCLTEAPRYKYQDYECSLHNAASAKKRLAERPDPKRIIRQRKARVRTVEDEDAMAELTAADIEALRHPLPFDLDMDPDNVIMKALRGTTLLVINSVSNKLESIRVPKNKNIKNDTMYLTETEEGKVIFNFLSERNFRSVAVKSILQIQ